ncbi:MAG: hypothetical protein H8E84_08815 [Flavobacteriales bacterium]|nr:hypothetical protein [Flavobacteriales bacterium]
MVLFHNIVPHCHDAEHTSTEVSHKENNHCNSSEDNHSESSFFHFLEHLFDNLPHFSVEKPTQFAITNKIPVTNQIVFVSDLFSSKINKPFFIEKEETEYFVFPQYEYLLIVTLPLRGPPIS